MNTNDILPFFLLTSRIDALIAKKLDGKIGGLSWKEFLILHTIASTDEKKMRRIDLAETLGLTPSGITRQLLPMEKIGYIRREIDTGDARVSSVSLGDSVDERLHDAYERIGLFLQDMLHTEEISEIEKTIPAIDRLSKRIG